MSTLITAAEIIDALRAADITAEVGQSGGGCATIYVGPTSTDDNGDTIHAALIGPGSYHWTEPLASTFYPGDLYVGPDDAGDDQDAVKACSSVAEVQAAVIATLGLDPHEVERAGLARMLADMAARPLAEIVASVYPNAEPLWGHGANSAMFAWLGSTIIVTEEIGQDADGDDRPVYLLGIYRVDDDGTQHDEPTLYVDLPRSPSAVLMYLHDLTELTPEGVDFAAWAAQWTVDAVDDGRLLGACASLPGLGEHLSVDLIAADAAVTVDRRELTDEQADRLVDAVDTMAAIIDACAEAGFSPVDDVDPLPQWITDRAYYAVRHQGDTIALVDVEVDADAVHLRHFTPVGVMLTSASFHTDRIGLRLFATAATCWP